MRNKVGQKRLSCRRSQLVGQPRDPAQFAFGFDQRVAQRGAANAANAFTDHSELANELTRGRPDLRLNLVTLRHV
jgi:hypothetical protein